MSQGWANLLGALTIDYRGTRYALGRTADSYAIWEAARGGPPVQTWPVTQEGWAQAWSTYQSWEGPAALAQVAPGAEPPLRTAAWTRGQPIPLQSMRVGQILDGAFKLYRLRFGTLILLVALVILPYELLGLFLGLATGESAPVVDFQGFESGTVFQAPLWVGILTGSVYFLVITPFLTAAVLKTAADAYLGRMTGVGEAYRTALPKIHSILWVTVLTTLAVLACFVPAAGLAFVAEASDESALAVLTILLVFLAAVPAVFPAIRFLFGAPAVVIEDQRGTAALRRSWRLARGFGGKILGTGLLAGLLILAVSIVFSIPLAIAVFAGGGLTPTAYAVGSVVNTVATILTTPFYTLVVVLLYFDIRIRKEGFDLEVMAQQIGAAPPAGA